MPLINLDKSNTAVSLILGVLGVLMISVSCASLQINGQKHNTESRTQNLAFLAGGILGDNTTWIIHGVTARHGLSISKQILLQKTLQDLRISRESESAILSLLQESIEESKRKNLKIAMQLNLEALLKTEDAVKSIYDQQIASILRFGTSAMVAVEFARWAEIGFESHQQHMAQMIIKTHVKSSVNGLDNIAQKTNLSRDTISYVNYVVNYLKKDINTINMRDINFIKMELEKLLKSYELQPLTEMQLYGDRIHLEDAILESPADDRVSNLIAHLKSQDENVRNRASSELTIIGKPAVKALITELKKLYIPGKGVPVADIAYSMNIGIILGNIGEVTLLPLMSTLETSRDGVVRFNAALALGVLGDKRAIPALERVSKEDPDSAVREAAKSAIEKINLTFR